MTTPDGRLFLPGNEISGEELASCRNAKVLLGNGWVEARP
jgi:hypothetical protein